jgi:hypothetical protein
MIKEDIIRMAREAGIRLASQSDTVDPRNVYSHEIERFAALVAAHEREECLKLVDEQIHNMTVLDSYPEQSGAIYQAIINIRARGEK